MNTKTVTIAILVAAVLFGFVWWSRSYTNEDVKGASPGAGSLDAAETLFDFGTISMKNGNVNHLFKVANSGASDIEIQTINTSCMCTSAYIEGAHGEKGPFGMPGMGFVPPANEIIKAGESRDIKVVYDPAAHGPAGVGPIDRFVMLTEKGGASLKLEIKAVVTP